MLALLSFLFLPASSIVLAQTIHTITVGQGGSLTFKPETITAATGDFVQFIFVAGNHTATQSSFNSPCSPLVGSDGVTQTGFDTGFEPVRADGNPITTGFPLLSTDPLWFYCRQKTHCHRGMVFAVNPPKTGRTFTKFKARAMGSSKKTSIATLTATTTITTTSSSSTATSSTAPTPDPTPVVHNVVVGGNSTMTFNPSNITAQPNDIVQFTFVSGNHTATQSTFANPCVQGLGNGSAGFNSGYMPVAADISDFPTFNITVNDTSSVWVFCAQDSPISHCGNGMVFAVNPVEDGPNNWGAFQAAAERFNGTITSTSSVFPTSTASTSSSGPSPTSRGTGGGSSSRHEVISSSVAIVAMAIGALLL